MEIPGVDLLFFYLTSFGATSTKSVRRLLFISPFSDEVSAQFSMSQLRNMIVLAALNGHTFWPPNCTFNAQRNGQGELTRR